MQPRESYYQESVRCLRVKWLPLAGQVPDDPHKPTLFPILASGADLWVA